MKPAFLIYFLAGGMVLPFLPVVLSHCELSSSQIALAISLGPVASTLLPPFYDLLTRRFAHSSLVTAACLLAVLPTILLSQDPRWPAILVLAFLLQASISVAGPTLEGLGLSLYPDSSSYSRQRLYGSLGFILGSLIAGTCLQSGNNLYWSLILAFVLIGSTPIYLRLPRLRPPDDDATRSAHTQTPTHWKMAFCLLFLTFCMNLAHAPYFTYLNLILKEVMQVPSTLHGTYWAVAVLAETLMMSLYATSLGRLNYTVVLAISLSMGIVRWLGMSEVESPSLVYALQCLHAFTFATFHLAIMHGLTIAFPAATRSRGTALYASVGFGLSMMLGNQICALFVADVGMQKLFLGFAAAPTIGLLLLPLFLKSGWLQTKA